MESIIAITRLPRRLFVQKKGPFGPHAVIMTRCLRGLSQHFHTELRVLIRLK